MSSFGGLRCRLAICDEPYRLIGVVIIRIPEYEAILAAFAAALPEPVGPPI
jgi:hypothetical protein